MKSSKHTAASATRRRRSKSIYAKGWATRRAKKAAAAQKPLALEIDREAVLAMAAEELQVDMPAPNNASAIDAIQRTLELNRDEQLLAFMGDLAAAREARHNQGHYPWLVSRTQIEAIEEFLSDHGYSAWGKGSGRLASVSTKPAA